MNRRYEIVADTLQDRATLIRNKDTSDRRDNARKHCLMRIAITVVARPGMPVRCKRMTAHLRDISNSGVGLLSHHPLENGTVISLDLSHLTVYAKAFQYVVVHCQLSSPGLFAIGAKPVGPDKHSDVAEPVEPIDPEISRIRQSMLDSF